MLLMLVALNVLPKYLAQIFSKSNKFILRNHLYAKNSVKSYCITFSLNVIRIIIALIPIVATRRTKLWEATATARTIGIRIMRVSDVNRHQGRWEGRNV